ncbi:T6SS effector BTH_I2691 family protein [Vibrio intestinalis]|uniref:T6SS effector BTH_I2691 family protein n=1 Tax=Vibrio intestinalis TaxID=2933291 RepID=UPI0021A2FDCE|nr:T6SS effector BTH_I2691 family protein [Vibrio intestinalis]
MSNAISNASEQSSQEAGLSLGTCPMQALGINIVPVRYALDELDDLGNAKNGLVNNWKGNGIFNDNLSRSQYTLRQLRDGWLYVLCDYDKTFHEYEVSGNNLIKYDLDTWIKEKGKTERGSAGKTAPFLTYNQNNTIYLAWSKQRWSWRLFNDVLKNKSNYKKWMRKVELRDYCQSMDAKHVGLITEIETFVSDISIDSSNCSKFLGHMTQTAAGENTKNTDIKPVVPKSALTSGMTDEQSAIFVALDDPICDLQELGLFLNKEVLEYEQLKETKEHKWVLLETAAKVTSLNAPEDLIYPASVNTNSDTDKHDYYAQLSEYLKLKADLRPLEALKSTHYGYAQRLLQEQKIVSAKKQLVSKYGEHDVDSETVFARWNNTKQWRDEVNNEKLLQAIEDFNTTDRPELENLVKSLNQYRQQLIASVQTFGWAPERGFIDHHNVDGQELLFEVHQFITEAMTKVIDDETLSWLEKEFEQPTTLIPLYLSGFSKELYLKIGSELIPNDTDNVSINDTGNFISRYNDFLSFTSSESIQSSQFYSDLSEKTKPVIQAFKQAIKTTGEATVSIIARRTTSFTFMLGNNGFIDRSTIAEQISLNRKIQISEDFLDARTNWKAQRTKIAQEVEELYQQLHGTKLAVNRADLDLAGYDPTTSPERIVEMEEQIDSAKAKQKAMNKVIDAKQRLQNGFDLLDEVEQQNLRTRYYTALSEMNELFYGTPSMMLIDGEDVAKEIRGKIKLNFKNSIKVTSKTFENLGGLGFLAFLFNARDLYMAYGDLKQNNVHTTREKAELVQKFSYTFSSLAAIFQSKSWRKVDKTSEFFYQSTIKRASNMHRSVSDYIRISRFTSSFAILAIGIELYFLKTDIDNETDETNKLYMQMKFNGLVLMGASEVAKRGAMILASRVSISFLVGSFVTGTALIGGILYLLSTLVLNGLKKDDYQKWLHRLPWSSKPSEKQFPDTPEGVAEALIALYQFTMQPKVYVQQLGQFTKISNGYGKVKFEREGLKLHVHLNKNLEQSNNQVVVNVSSPRKYTTIASNFSNTSESLNYDLKIKDSPKKELLIEVSFYIDATKGSKLNKKLTYNYSIDIAQIGIHSMTLIQPLNSNEEKVTIIQNYHDQQWYTNHQFNWSPSENPVEAVII